MSVMMKLYPRLVALSLVRFTVGFLPCNCRCSVYLYTLIPYRMDVSTDFVRAVLTCQEREE